MNRPVHITRGAWALLGLSTILTGIGFALPRLQPVPTGVDTELIALRGESDAVATNDDATLESLRQQVKEQPPIAWSAEKFMERVGTGWRVEWQPPADANRTVLLSRSAPRLHDWPAYLKFVKSWIAQPGIVLESLDVTGNGTAHAREFSQVVIGLRIILTGAPIGNAERDAPSRVPLPVAAAEGPATSRKIGPVTSLRRPSASAEPPAPGQADASFRPDPPGPRAGLSPPNPPTNP